MRATAEPSDEAGAPSAGARTGGRAGAPVVGALGRVLSLSVADDSARMRASAIEAWSYCTGPKSSFTACGILRGADRVGVVVRAALDEDEAFRRGSLLVERAAELGMDQLVVAAVDDEHRRPDLPIRLPASKRWVTSGATGSQPQRELAMTAVIDGKLPRR